jgi:hypothetical protein
MKRDIYAKLLDWKSSLRRKPLLLQGAMARSPVELSVHGKRLFNEYEGAFVENYIAQ